MNDNEKQMMWEILVPTMRNDERPISTRFHRVWDEKVRNISNGLTILPPTLGQWIDPKSNLLYKERMIPVKIMCTRKNMDEIIDMTGEYYEQKAIIAYKISDECILREFDIDENNTKSPTHEQLISRRAR